MDALAGELDTSDVLLLIFCCKVFFFNRVINVKNVKFLSVTERIFPHRLSRNTLTVNRAGRALSDVLDEAV